MPRSEWRWSNYKGDLPWLQKNTLLLTRHGSHAYGTNIETSDEDWRGIVIPPKQYIIGALHKFEQVEQHEPDLVIFELRKAINLLTQCNPNIIEILFTDPSDHVVVNKIGKSLLDIRDLFITKRARHTFSGYAFAQLSRMALHQKYLRNPLEKKPERSDFGLPNETLVPKDQLKAVEAEIQKRIDVWSMSYLDGLPDAQRINLVNRFSEHLAEIKVASSPDLWEPAARILGASDNLIEAMKRERQYTTAKRDFDKYQEWKKNRNPARAAMEAKFGYDGKNALHLVRLIRVCKEILSGKGVIVRRPDAEELLAIRNGAWSVDQLIEYAKNEEKEIQILADKSDLPHSPDLEKIDSWLIKTLDKFTKKKIRKFGSIVNIGDKFGMVTVLSDLGMRREPSGHNRRWFGVRCECGTEYEAPNIYLVRENVPKCQKCKAVATRLVVPGERFDKLTVKCYDETIRDDKKRKVICVCDCGKEYKIRATSLIENRRNSCGCEDRDLYTGYEDLSGTAFYRIKRNAYVRNLDFLIDIEFLWNLFLNQEKKCALTGLPITLTKRGPYTASLDRKDSSKHYTHDNVQWVHKDVNLMKMDLDEDRFFDLCRMITREKFGIE